MSGIKKIAMANDCEQTDAASDEEALSSMPNSEKKPAAGLRARFDQEEELEDPMLFEK